MSEIFTEAFILGLLGTTVRAAAPLILAAIRESFSQLSGVINVGLEGYLLTGAFFGYLVSHYTDSAWLGALGGVAGGGLVALLAAYVMITRRADQIVTGLAPRLRLGRGAPGPRGAAPTFHHGVVRGGGGRRPAALPRRAPGPGAGRRRGGPPDGRGARQPG